MTATSYPRPRFVREESWRYKRVKSHWRSPRGKTSRVRRSKNGWPAVVKIGYSRPKATRGIHPSGLREIIIWRPSDLANVDPAKQVARIAHTVGENKRVLILEEAKKRSIRILNHGLKKVPETEVIPEPASETIPTEPTTGAKEETAMPDVEEETATKEQETGESTN
jgi:large subunit ribosomal protein L32e